MALSKYSIRPAWSSFVSGNQTCNAHAKNLWPQLSHVFNFLILCTPLFNVPKISSSGALATIALSSTTNAIWEGVRVVLAV